MDSNDFHDLPVATSYGHRVTKKNWWRFGAVGSDFGYSAPGPVSTGMGDRIGVQLLVWESYLSLTNHPGQLSLAILHG